MVFGLFFNLHELSLSFCPEQHQARLLGPPRCLTQLVWKQLSRCISSCSTDCCPDANCPAGFAMCPALAETVAAADKCCVLLCGNHCGCTFCSLFYKSVARRNPGGGGRGKRAAGANHSGMLCCLYLQMCWATDMTVLNIRSYRRISCNTLDPQIPKQPILVCKVQA